MSVRMRINMSERCEEKYCKNLRIDPYALCQKHVKENISIVPVSTIVKLYNFLPLKNDEKGEIKNPEFWDLHQVYSPDIQNEHFPYTKEKDGIIDFQEAYIIILSTIVDRQWNTEVGAVVRIWSSRFRYWVELGDFLVKKGYTDSAFIMYSMAALLGTDRSSKEYDSINAIDKALEIFPKIKTSIGLMGFKKIWSSIKCDKKMTLPILLEMLLNKCLTIYNTRQGIKHNDSLDIEIKYLSSMYQYKFYHSGEWLAYNILNLAVNAMDMTHLEGRMLQAKDLICIANGLMKHCFSGSEEYRKLFDWYLLTKCIFWGTLIMYTGKNFSDRFVTFESYHCDKEKSKSLDLEVINIKDRKTLKEEFEKILDCRSFLTSSKIPEIVEIYQSIITECKNKYSCLQ